MNTLMNAEKFIRQSYLSNDEVSNLAYRLFYFYYKVTDEIEKTSHCTAINFLYQVQNSKFTNRRIAEEIFSNEKSLLTDRKKYTDCFYYFYDYVQTHQFTEETAIASLS